MKIDTTIQGHVSEMFRSIQGEGPYVGVMQLFLRLAGCRLRCVYCDSPCARETEEEFVIHGGTGDLMVPNPVEAGELALFAGSLAQSSHGIHSLSVTGGEPLEQGDFLAAFLRLFAEEGLPVYLETNGLEEEAAVRIAPLVDIVSMDIKLPSLCGGGDFLHVYERVLPLFGKRELFCKVVVAEGFDLEELVAAAGMVARFDRGLPFIIQPATQVKGCRSVSGAALLECFDAVSSILDNVRVIPQCHNILGVP